jgi:hypothetical protein
MQKLKADASFFAPKMKGGGAFDCFKKLIVQLYYQKQEF